MLHTSSKHQRTQESGFTIVEMMVVVLILGVLTAIALPSFRPVFERWRVKNSMDSLQNSFYLAKSEAIKRSGGIMMRKRNSFGNCVSTGNADWKCGWDILDSDMNVLHTIEISPNVELTMVSPAVDNRIFFDRWGVITNSVGSPVAAFSFDLVAKHRTLTDTGSLRLCIGGAASKSKQIKGVESC